MRQSHANRQSSQKRCSHAVCTGLSSTPWQMEQRRWRLIAAASTKSSASRPIVPCGFQWGCVAQGVGHRAARGARARRSSLNVSSAARQSIAQPAIGAPDGRHSAFPSAAMSRCACPPRTKYDGRRMRQKHESILRIAGARRATAAARRRTTSASSAAARASSAEERDARRPRSETPHPHHSREAPSGPRPAAGSCARSASRPVGSSGPCTYEGAATARRGPATTAGRAAFVQLVAAVFEVFAEAAPAACARRTTRPRT